jgi:hypothetical protein
MKRIFFLKVGIGVLSVIGLAAVGSAKEPLVTDRPDFTESSSSVGSGVLQLESGITFLDLQSGTEVTTVGEILARWGVAEKFELRFVLPTYSRTSGAAGGESGFLCADRLDHGADRDF